MTTPDPTPDPAYPDGPAPTFGEGTLYPQSPAGWQQPYAPTYPPQYFPAAYPHVVTVQKLPTSGAAVAALIFGIISALGGFCLLGIPCVVAVLCGHIGLADTKEGIKSGRGMAIAGLILGYLCLIPAVVFFVSSGLGMISS